MPIVNASPTDRAGFLDLVNAEIRPDNAKTNAWDDFPVILGPQNSQWQLLFKTEEGQIAGCIACLIRSLKTSCGVIAVAGVGSVVTREDFRGQGISSALQNEMLMRLKRQNIPLAVLWTDKPEIYAGRGFQPAGWEIHVSIQEMANSRSLEPGFSTRDFQADDTAEVEKLYSQNPWGNVREPGDSAAYYTMPGTDGLVLVDAEKRIVAAAFCGKGGDFPGYICEFSGPDSLLPTLFAQVRHRFHAHQVLVPAGRENLVNQLVDLGCSWTTTVSGCWAVLDAQPLQKLAQMNGLPLPEDPNDAQQWLGYADEEGLPREGVLNLAVWGFDSV